MSVDKLGKPAVPPSAAVIHQSTEILTAIDPNIKMTYVIEGAAQKVDAAVRHIEEARKLNETLQKQYAPDSASYAQCEQIDDKLFDALQALGN